MGSWLVHPQKHLGTPGLVALMLLAGLMSAFSADMYTPAVPSLVNDLNTTPAAINITLVGFFAVNAIGLLVFGPISDRKGRKPVYLLGTAIYIVSSMLCAMSATIEMLIAARLLQAIACGAMGAMGTAIVKDAVVPEKREAILSIVSVMFVIGPVIAPIVGAFILQVATWHVTFWVLAGIGVICLILGLLYTETLPDDERSDLGVLRSMGRLGAICKNKGFTLFLVSMAMFGIPFFAYIAVASYIYIDFFNVGTMGYSLFFALVALLSSVGPLVWLAVRKHITIRKFNWLVFIVSLIAGIAMLIFGSFSPWAFCLIFLVFAFAESCSRPYTTNVLLSQQKGDTGAASSVINFGFSAIGCVGMFLAVLPWPNYVFGIAVITIVSIIIGIVVWAYLLKSDTPLNGVK